MQSTLKNSASVQAQMAQVLFVSYKEYQNEYLIQFLHSHKKSRAAIPEEECRAAIIIKSK